jgi:hypothetical protein
MFTVGKSLFTSNRPSYPNNIYVIASSGSGTASGVSGDETDLIRQLMLSSTMTNLTTYYTNYINGQFSAVKDPFSVDNEFSKLSFALSKLRKNSKYTTYEMVRKSIVTSLELLQQSLNQYIDRMTATGQLATYKAKADILDSAEKLELYIQGLNDKSEMTVFPQVAVAAPLFSLKPEYVAYIQEHGFPEGGVFDATLLAAILQDIDAGLI